VTRETFVVARAIHVAAGEDDAAVRTTVTTKGEILVIVITNNAATNAVCLANFPAYVFTRPTSVAIGIAFSSTRSILAETGPTQATKTLIYISIGSTLARTSSGSSPAVADPKS